MNALALVGLPVGYSPALALTLEDANAAYLDRNYTRALAILLPLAEAGDAVARFNLANLYRNGTGVDRDYRIAFKWLRRSALLGYIPAQNNLGTMYRDGLGTPKDAAEALKWYSKSAESGDTHARINLARAHWLGMGTLKDDDKAVRLLEGVLNSNGTLDNDVRTKKAAIEQLALVKNITEAEVIATLPAASREFLQASTKASDRNARADPAELSALRRQLEESKERLRQEAQQYKDETERLRTEQAKIAKPAPTAPPPAEMPPLKVHALVIGNNAYPGSAALVNPVSDARAVAAKFRSYRFTVTEVIDATRSVMVSALAEYSRHAADADVTVLFYAGHGVQLFGSNYILPIDADLTDIAQATLQGISLNAIVDQYLRGRVKLVFLDACRDNPLARTESRGYTAGLAPISVSEGTLISYATKDGGVAADGPKGTHSPFTSALLESIDSPEDIAVVLRRVRERVMKATKGKQQPWEYGSLTGGQFILSRIPTK